MNMYIFKYGKCAIFTLFQSKEVKMKNEFTEGVKVLNIVIQSFLSLILDIFVAVGLGWLLVEKLGAPDWTYAVVITLGVLIGLLSMLKFILAASANMEKIEQDKKKDSEEKRKKAKKQKELRDFFNGKNEKKEE